MAKYRVVNLEQGTDEWLDWRRGGVTATNAIIIGAKLKGVKPYPQESVYRSWAEKFGIMSSRDLSMNPNVIRGNQFEDQARQAAEKHLNDFLIPLCVESKFDSKIRASLDGITSEGYPVELKCPHESTWEAIKAEGPNAEVFKRYWIQVQHQLMTLGVNKGFLAFFLVGQPLMIFEVKVDKKFLSELYRLEKEFWNQVETRSEPELDLQNDHYIPKGQARKEWIYHSEQYKSFEDRIADLESQVEALKEAQKEHREALISQLSDHRTTEFNGVQVTQYVRNGSFDTDKLVEKLKQLDPNFNEIEYRKGKSSAYRFSLTGSDMPRYLNDEEIESILKGKQKEFKTAWF